MRLTKEERKELTYQIGDIIEQKCRRCYYNRSASECFSVNECKACPTGEELRQLGRYLDTQPKKNGGQRKRVPVGLTPEIVRNLNMQGIPDKDISIMYARSPSYVGKMKKQWKQNGIWKGPTDTREIKKARIAPSTQNISRMESK
ncbi:hypothetical protein QUF83_23885 [Bacillus cereus]|uniref:hypothetical protein n=1 Tax=Bacillus cereus TaxID=1396 RepID=UPI0025A28E4B|nr:hypothetical protein [Bacillus cereus]MDM5239081.1 hypothetical protein [Bacillus cereus]